MIQLYGLRYSPWTEKARWALEHHQLPYKYHEHLLLFGMPALRLRLRRLWGGVTVPALTNGHLSLIDSMKIARYADEIGRGKTLFPSKLLEEVIAINALSETALDAARALTIERFRKDPEAQAEAMKGLFPQKLIKYLLPMAQMAMTYLKYEFNIDRMPTQNYLKEYRHVLKQLRKKIQESRGLCLLGNFSFADIAGAVMLHGVEPVSDAYLRMGPSLRRTWRTPSLIDEFSDLLEWRDKIYQKYRRHEVSP